MKGLPHIDRRRLLIGGGVGLGLVVGYAVWPKRYPVTLSAAAGEHVFGGFLKIGEDGHVTVAVPQLEHGQGSWTALPQLVADELGADWRTVAVEPAPLSPLYANPLAWRALFEGGLDRALTPARVALMATIGSSSIRNFAEPLADAGAVARNLLCQEAAARADIDWRTCRTEAGFVIAGDRRFRFADLAADAAARTPPQVAPRRRDEPGRLIGKSLPRLDAPAKVDGSANFAADIRLPGMVFAAVRAAPEGGRLTGYDRTAADRVPGARQLLATDGFLAAVGTTWWAAAKALDAAKPRFAGPAAPGPGAIDRALRLALAGEGARVAAAGDLDAVFAGAGPAIVTADYLVAPGRHAALETASATARFGDGGLELWLPTQAPGAARGAAAAVLGIDPDRVVIHNVFAGGASGERLEVTIAEQAAYLARELARPVQLTWSRAEDLRRDRQRPPARVRLQARLSQTGQIAGWHARAAAPATGRELATRLFGNDLRGQLITDWAGRGDPYAVAGLTLPYGVQAYAIDHHAADVRIATGHARGGAHVANVFARESFIDELARQAGSEPVSFRIGMLGGDARLARCLSTAASLGGWEGGVPGSGQGIACHAMRGSRIAVLVEAHFGDGGRPVVDRIVAAVDCGRLVNPELVRQQIEGGLIAGLAAARGDDAPAARTLGAVGLPRLADISDITVELIPSEAEPGGASELGVPPVAPAIANALFAETGTRIRRLPLTS